MLRCTVKLMFITRAAFMPGSQPVTDGGEVKPWALRNVAIVPN